jgi:hypothetical protein
LTAGFHERRYFHGDEPRTVITWAQNTADIFKDVGFALK